MLWWASFRSQSMYPAIGLHKPLAFWNDFIIMSPPDLRDTVSTTISSGQTCTGSCRRRSTLDTCHTCPTASSWSAILIGVWCMPLSTWVSTGTDELMSSTQLTIAHSFKRAYHSAGFGSTGFLQFSVLREVHLRFDQMRLTCAWCTCSRTKTWRKVWIHVCRFELDSFYVLNSSLKSLFETMMVR